MTKTEQEKEKKKLLQFGAVEAAAPQERAETSVKLILPDGEEEAV